MKKVVEKWEIQDEKEEVARLEEEAKKLVLEKLYKWIKIFGKKVSERILTRKIQDHTIDMKKGFVLKKGKVYLLSREEREEMHKFIKEQLRKGYIRSSKLSQMALVFFVEKKNEKKKMVQDYWYLSKWTVKNNYPLLLISDVIKNISTKKMFTKIDLRQGYNNMRIKEGEEQKVIFTTSERSFKSTVMFFGLTNSPVTFQMIMNELLRNLINIGKMAAFIDNVIIGIENEEGHNELVGEIVKRLKENDLYVKPEKCKWKMREVEFLGVIIGLEEIKMEKEKVKSVLDQLTPKCVKDIQKFLGLVNYYHQFIQGFATIARPLYDIVKKDQKWKWMERQKEVFRELKKKFTKELVLVALDLNKKMRMEVNTSDYTTGRVLFMECKDER